MLTGLKVSGFKNLMDVDIRFSPFTCIAGANGVGKSNLFDGALLPILNWLFRRLGVKVAIQPEWANLRQSLIHLKN